MDIQEKLDSIERKRQDFLNQTIAEKNTQLIKESYDEYVSAKEINAYAPKQLDQAETNYFKAKYGIDYIDKQKEKYKTETLQMTKDKLKAHQEQMAKLNETLDNYKNSEKYSKSINDVKGMHLANIKTLIKKIRLSDVDTTEQKAFFKQKDEAAIRWHIITLNWFIGLFTAYFIFMNRNNRTKKTIGQVVFLITIIFLVKYIVLLVEQLFKFKLHFGYDPMKSKIPWMLWTLFVLAAIWVWVYLDVFSQLSQTQFVPPPRIIGPMPPTTYYRITAFFSGIFQSISAFFVGLYPSLTAFLGFNPFIISTVVLGLVSMIVLILLFVL